MLLPLLGRNICYDIIGPEPDARHLPSVERPEAFNRVLLRWLDARR